MRYGHIYACLLVRRVNQSDELRRVVCNPTMSNPL